MALFTDGSISSLEDLAAEDSQLLDISSEEGINVTQKIALAQNQIGMDLVSMLNGFKSWDWPIWMVQEPHLSQIVVTPALKLWHTYLSLEMVYRDAYADQLNDRYAAKRDQFHLLAAAAREKLIRIGIGIVAQPIPQAATPQLTAVPGTLPDAIYYVTMTWVNQLGEQGASSLPEAITTANSSFEVQPGTPPQSATGWNVYVGNSPQVVFIQNTTPIALGDTWQQDTPPVSTGATPGNGQTPTYWKPLPRGLQRG
jgi:hypothetical protein